MSRVIVSLFVLFGLVAVAMLGGCHRSTSSAVPIAGLEIAPEHGPTVYVDNFNGSVTVTADPRVKQPVVRTRVHSPDRRYTWNRKELATKVDVKAESVIEDGRRVLRIKTAPKEETERLSVHVDVRVARTEGVHVMNAGGPVELVRVSGPISVQNGVGGAPGGNVSVRTGAPMTEPVTLTTSEGNVLYQIGHGSSGVFDLQTDSGIAEFYAKIGKITQIYPEVNRYRAVLNDGTNPISLRSGKGTVRSVIIANSDTYGPDRWDGYPRWPQYPKPIGRLGGYHNDEPLFRKRAAQPANP